jgi:hypothetical protein
LSTDILLTGHLVESDAVFDAVLAFVFWSRLG